jgi:hypothetical protein
MSCAGWPSAISGEACNRTLKQSLVLPEKRTFISFDLPYCLRPPYHFTYPFCRLYPTCKSPEECRNDIVKVQKKLLHQRRYTIFFRHVDIRLQKVCVRTCGAIKASEAKFSVKEMVIEHEGNDIYGRIKSGYLKLFGLCRQAWIVHDTGVGVSNSNSRGLDSDQVFLRRWPCSHSGFAHQWPGQDRRGVSRRGHSIRYHGEGLLFPAEEAHRARRIARPSSCSQVPYVYGVDWFWLGDYDCLTKAYCLFHVA